MNTRTNQPTLIHTLRHGFTIVELLVVILIGLIILSIAVPAFQSMSYSSNRSLAVNALQASSLMARDVALNSGQDGAVVFVFDPAIGKVQIIPAVKIGTIRESSTAPSGPGGGFASGLGDQPYFDRDVFVPASSGQTLEMPRYWMVRGYVPSGALTDRDSTGNPAVNWYTSPLYGGTEIDAAEKKLDHWVFPETGFFPVDAQITGGDLRGDFGSVNSALPTGRQSFMIRFNARTGVMSRDTNTALFVNPRNSRERPYGDRPTQFQQTLRADLAENLETWAARIVNAEDLTGDGVQWNPDDEQLRTQLIGNASNDTILVKPVTRLAVYDERKLAIALGTRGLNAKTQSLYKDIDQRNSNAEIEIDMDLFPNGLSLSQILERIDQWVDGDTNFDGYFGVPPGGTIDDSDEPESRMYLIQSYTGELKEVLR